MPTEPDPSVIDSSLAPAQVVSHLDPRLLRLVEANRVLFAGRWDDLAEDIRRRSAGRPYLFKLELGLAEPLAWIGRLRDYESARGESLADAIPA